MEAFFFQGISGYFTCEFRVTWENAHNTNFYQLQINYLPQGGKKKIPCLSKEIPPDGFLTRREVFLPWNRHGGWVTLTWHRIPSWFSFEWGRGSLQSALPDDFFRKRSRTNAKKRQKEALALKKNMALLHFGMLLHFGKIYKHCHIKNLLSNLLYPKLKKGNLLSSLWRQVGKLLTHSRR